ncbi:hypothetical protein D0T87_09170 [Bacteroides sp. 51]|nr:hypothetical protein [Bacteroides sp. 51]
MHAKNESIIYLDQKAYGRGQKEHRDTTRMPTRYHWDAVGISTAWIREEKRRQYLKKTIRCGIPINE